MTLENAESNQAESLIGFAQRVRVLREAKQWTQADLARATGLSRAYIKTIEDGKTREPSARTIGLLSMALGVNVVDLMQAANALPPDYYQSPLQTDLDLTMYLRRQRRLSEDFVKLITRFITLAEIDEGTLVPGESTAGS